MRQNNRTVGNPKTYHLIIPKTLKDLFTYLGTEVGKDHARASFLQSKKSLTS